LIYTVGNAVKVTVSVWQTTAALPERRLAGIIRALINAISHAVVISI
jgi:hypothetical protein